MVGGGGQESNTNRESVSIIRETESVQHAVPIAVATCKDLDVQ